MQSSVGCVTNESSSRCGCSESSNADEEEDRGRVKEGNPDDCDTLIEQAPKDCEHSIESIAKALSQFKRRNFQRHRILHPRQSSGLRYGVSAVASLDSSLHPPLTLTTDLKAATLTVSLSSLPTESVASQTFRSGNLRPTPIISIPNASNVLPTTVTARTDTSSVHASSSTYLTTVTSFTSKLAPNATTSRTTREGSVVIITASGIRNLNLTQTMTTMAIMRSMTSTSESTQTTSQISLSSTTTKTTTQEAYTTVVYDEVPLATTLNTPPTPTSTSTDDNSGSGGGSAPVQPRMLGGILGGIAGLGLMFFLVLLFIKRHKKRLLLQAQDDAGYGGPLPSPNRSMVQRSMSFFGSSGLLPGYHRPVEDPEPQERGFVRVSGRKLPPVLGGPRPDYGSMRSAGEASSYYRDDDNFTAAGAPSTPLSTYIPGRYSSPPPPSPSARPGVGSSRLKEQFDNASIDEVGPGSSQGNPFRTSNRSPLYLPQLSATGSDGVGRSLASHDGSKASRFTEDVT